MTGKFRIGTVMAKDCGTVISVPKDSGMDFSLEKMDLTNCKVGFEERDYSSLAQSVGLPANTPPGLILELVDALNKPTGEPVNVNETVKQSRLWEYFLRTGEAASVIEKLMALGAPAAKALWEGLNR